jgi:hypothetical protein
MAGKHPGWTSGSTKANSTTTVIPSGAQRSRGIYSNQSAERFHFYLTISKITAFQKDYESGQVPLGQALVGQGPLGQDSQI